MRKIKSNKLQLINKVLKWHFNYYILRKASPLVCSFYVTNYCNLRCKMCNLWRNKDKKMIKLDDFKTIIDDLSRNCCYYLSFAGGEPLLAKDIVKMIRYAKEKIPYVHIVTNGLLITGKKAKELAGTGVDEISLSIDGLASMHDKIRGMKGSFERTIEAINNLKKYAPKIDIVINTTIGSFNINELDGVVKLAEDLGVKQQFQPINEHPLFDRQLSKASMKKLDEGEIKKIENFIKKILKKTHVVNSKYFLAHIPDYFKGNLNKGLFNEKCKLQYYFCEIRENNELYPCLMAFNWKNGFQLNNNLKGTFYSKEYKRKQKELKDCRLCQKSMYVCYLEPRVAFPIVNYIKYDLLYKIK